MSGEKCLSRCGDEGKTSCDEPGKREVLGQSPLTRSMTMGNVSAVMLTEGCGGGGGGLGAR